MQLLLTLLCCLAFFNPSSASPPFSDVKLVSTNENGGQVGLIDRPHKLECFAENLSASRKPMTFIWKIDGRNIVARRGRYTTVRYNSTETNGFSILKIRKIKQTDAALYTCKVVNDMGSVEYGLNLSVETATRSKLAKRPQGADRRNSTLPTEYFPRSDQLNQVIDDILGIYSKSLLFHGPFHTSIESISPHLETESWAYLSKPPQPTGAVSNWTQSLFSPLPSEEEADDDDNVTEEEQLVDHDEEEDKDEEDAEELMDAEDQDDENDSENSENGAQDATETDQKSVTEKKNNGFLFSQTAKPSETPDNNFEFNFRLLSENELTLPEVQEIAITESSNQKNARERTNRKFKGKFRRNSKRLNAKVKGFQNLKRTGDVMVKNTTNDTKVLQIPIQIGPIRYTMKKMAGFELSNVSVTSPVLTARLRLVERDGRIVHALIKPKKVHRSWMIVTYAADKLPSQVQCGRLVTHSSRQMAKMWNSGLFLRRIGRDMKQFLKYQELTTKLMDISDAES